MSSQATAGEVYTKENPFVSQLLANIKLNKEGSIKDTRHLEFDLKGSGINYLPGDALYIFAENEKSLVEKTLGLLELSQDPKEEFERFSKEINITRPSNKLFKLIESKIPELDAKDLAEKFNGYSSTAILETLGQEHSLKLTSDELAENSSKLNPRAYSIASSLRAHPEQVDLCISRVDEEINGQKILGVCSNYICDRVENNSREVRVYIHRNDKFRLPENKESDIIMVGPGTGIAPFRAFIEERNADRKAGEKVGRDWLFFGDQREAYDYLYGEELEQHKEEFGLEISKAFSRDQEHKIYVQNRMEEHADEIYKRMKAGAYFYVCGDARRMAKDVDNTLKAIYEKNGEDPEAAIKELKDSGRYCRDVY